MAKQWAVGVLQIGRKKQFTKETFHCLLFLSKWAIKLVSWNCGLDIQLKAVSSINRVHRIH